MAEAGQDAFVMDASAIVALLDREKGFERVAAVLGKSAMSTVNLAEVQSRAALQGHDPDTIAAHLEFAGLRFEPFTSADAAAAGGLRPLTRALGLSLADRACLAVAARLLLPVLTSDRALARSRTGVDVELIR